MSGGTGGSVSAGDGGVSGMVSGGMGASGAGEGGGSPVAGNGGAGGIGGGGSGGAGFGPPQFDPADHCAPGEYFGDGEIEADRAFGGLAINCYNEPFDSAIENGIGDDVRSIMSIRLPEPMRIGQAMAISGEFRVVRGVVSPQQVEYWAATDECGSSGSLHRFYINQAPMTGVHCGSIEPSESFAYILRVMRPGSNPDAPGGLTAYGVTLCMSGTCPAP